MKKKEVKKEVKQRRKARPKFDAPRLNLGAAGSGIGGIQISMNQDFNVSDSLFMSAFNMSEVDQPPRPMRTFPPNYPYLAKRDNITGRLVLKFVVDVDGLAKEAEVLRAEPPEVLEIFRDAALKAIERYKFKPAVKNGKDVICIAILPIAFNLE
jgi:protein TonB